MAKELDLRKNIALRRYKKPNTLAWLFYWFVGKTYFLGAKYHPHFKRTDSIGDCKGPAFVIWNHQSRRDHTFITSLTFPRKISIVCEYNEFFRGHLAGIFKLMNILPKKVFCNDFGGIKAMRDVIKAGGIVAFSPEGTSSIFGDNQPIVPGTGRFIQAFKIPVYIVYLRGSYLTNNKIDDGDRIGEVYAESKLLFTPEQLKNMKPEEIDERINLEFKHDDYKWNKEHHVEYKYKKSMTRNLSDICYECPKCGDRFHMICENDEIKCPKCGNGAKMDHYYDFHNFEGAVIPDTPTEWAHLERQHIIDEIRADKNFVYEFNVKVGELPNDHYLDKTKTSEICGKGKFRIDHSGIHFNGVKNEKEWTFNMNFEQIWTYPMSVDLSLFSLYVDGEYYDFIPEIRNVGYVIMLTEEMHRLHVNRFKNFPWFDYMYEGKELGIDNKNS